MTMWMMLLAAAQGDASIVVTGKRLDEALAACRQGKCTALQDARVSVAMAEKQFRDGDYRSAKSTLHEAIGRTKRFAASDPKPVAALYEAYGTITRHDGDMRQFQMAVGSQYRILRDHLPAKDPAVSDAAIALGDMWLKQGNANDAEAAYADAERLARVAGSDVRLLTASVRRIALADARGDPEKAKRLLAGLEGERAATSPLYRLALSTLRLRRAIRQSDDAEVARLMPQVAAQSGARPSLVYAPPLEGSTRADASASLLKFEFRDPFPASWDDDGTLRWVDIGFWVRPDGRTDDIEVLRGSGTPGWIKPVTKQIAERRYTAAPDADGGPGTYMVERATFRPEYRVPIGSLVRRRSGAGSIELHDLTDGASATPGSGKPARSR
jgi:tetratricopeptide (TPR) repeat protein